jgi:DNA polymerase-1
VAADYSQIEMRLLAHLCNDVSLAAVFTDSAQGTQARILWFLTFYSLILVYSGGDIYKSLASHLFSKPVSSVSDEDRNSAKVICLGVIYGMGSPTIASRLGVSVSTASGLSSSFFKRFPKIHSWIEQTKKYAVVI